MYVWMVKTL